MDRDSLSSAAIMDCDTLAHSSRTNRVTKCHGNIQDRVIGINLILSSPCAGVRMQPKRLFHSKQKGHIRINIGNTGYPENNQQFIESIRSRSPELKPKVQKRIRTLFVTSYTKQHSQRTAKTTKKTLTGTRKTSL